MSQTSRRAILLAVMLVLLALVAAWSYSRYVDARARALTARTDTDAAIALAHAIDRLRQQPTLADAPELGDPQLTALLYRSAEAAAINPDLVIQSIRHQPPRKIDGAGYSRKSTDLGLRAITLEQLTRFLYDLEQRNPGLKVSALQLTDAVGQGPSAMWNVEPLTLSYLVPNPRPEGSRRSNTP